MVTLAGLQTEGWNPASANIDRVSAQELCRIINQEDAQIPKAVECCVPVIANVIDVLTERVRKGGRVFYIGAGTSGRLGVLDASEIPPTYSASPDLFVALIAGGDYALRKAKEGAEDSRSGAEEDLKPFSLDPDVDTLIGIASSGRTPYVLGGLEYAKNLGCVTVGLVCVDPSAIGIEGNADYLIAPITGPEVVTGSTRMKAGTATKLVLNMVSTGIMIRIGKTFGNMMIDVKATNIKLQQRAKNILRFVGGEYCTQTDSELEQILEACHGSVKLAATTIVLGAPVQVAEERLEHHQGVLTNVLEENELSKRDSTNEPPGNLVLCIDAGGSSCKAVILSPDGASGQGASGPCNVSSIRLEVAIERISEAVQAAIDNHPSISGPPFRSVVFDRVWVGLAGYDRPNLKPLVDKSLSEAFHIPLNEGLTVTADTDLLIAGLNLNSDVTKAIVLIVGTGSVAMSFTRNGNQFCRKERVGGWGSLLGDDGSGYAIGREAIRRSLRECDLYRMKKSTGMQPAPFSPLANAILKHFQSRCPNCTPEHFLNTLLVPDPSVHGDQNRTSATTKLIASAAEVVVSMPTDKGAREVLTSGAESVADLVTMLVHGQGLESSDWALVLGGGLMGDNGYRENVLRRVEERCGDVGHVQFVDEPARHGAQRLLETSID